MAQRFGSGVHQRDSRSALFGGYTGGETSRRDGSPASGGTYGYGGGGGDSVYGNRYSSYGGDYGQQRSAGGAAGAGSFRAATPNRKGQYSEAALSGLESQNEDEVAGVLGRVRALRQVSDALGVEIRDSSALAGAMNDSFDRARLRLRGTTDRMLRMAARSGVPWKVWLLFFLAVILVFTYVWLF